MKKLIFIYTWHSMLLDETNEEIILFEYSSLKDFKEYAKTKIEENKNRMAPYEYINIFSDTIINCDNFEEQYDKHTFELDEWFNTYKTKIL
jgi:hypothetical protein